LANPVEFGAVDGQPVFVLFATVSPSVKTHLELLSQLSYCLRDEAFLTLLRRDPAQADLLREAERRIAQLPHPR
jgi:PTS system nitrogen regulatory IIA component